MQKIIKTIALIMPIFIIAFSISFATQPVADTIVHSARADSLYGDVDNNSLVEASDALIVLQNSIGKVVFTDLQIILADVDIDGEITSKDALIVLQRSIGKIPIFPAGDIYIEKQPDDTLIPDGFIPVSSDEYLAYNELNDTQKSVYNIAYENIKECSTEAFSVGSARTVSLVDMMLGVRAVLCDHPELFWAMTSFAYSSVNYGNRIVQFYGGGSHTYIYNPEDVDQMQTILDAKINEIFAKTINPSMSEAEIALALHNWIVENTTYNYLAINDENAHRDAWSAYAALIDGTAVCEGLSKAYQLLLYRAGINCGVVTGPGHMWNYVEIDGEWYYTDITWADRDVPNDPLYHFYNQTYEVMSQSRNFDSNIEDLTDSQLLSIISNGIIEFNYNIPKNTTATAANWFVQNGLYFENDADFIDRINDSIINFALNGEKSIQVMINGKYFYQGSDVDVYINQIDWKGILWNLPADKRFSSITRYFKNYACGFLIIWS